ncbi:MAG: F0F1 ATP synthase subunit delta [Pyrinomonadaceae bacterium]|nr:F0F1 ATP synthase subunit delta [Pyrinomonadaceae bacterium]
MSIETIARRYANALADVVTKTGETSVIQDELKQFERIMFENKNLHAVFSNPAVPSNQKSNLLETLLQKTQPKKTTANFLRVLLQNHRLDNLNVVNNSFANLLEERAGLVSAEITTAQPLAAEQQTALRQKLEQSTGKKVVLNFKIDESIIGGVLTRIGSTLYDGSVKNQLSQLKQEIIKA